MRMSGAMRSRDCLGLGVLAVAISGCDLPWQTQAQDEAIALSGTVDAHQVDLGFQVAGRVQAIGVEEGEAVDRGQVLARLEPEDYQLALAEARARAQAARKGLAALRAGTREQEIRAGEAELARARADKRFADSEVRRVQALVPKDLASAEELDRAQMQADRAAAAVAKARHELDLLREGPRQEDIEQAAAELSAREAAVATAERRLSYTKLQAPARGVVQERLAEPGRVVSAGTPVLRVTELQRPWVRAYLSETDLARVRQGQPARVQVDGLPGRSFKGRLAFIASEAEFTPKTVETRELRVDLVYRIKINLDNPEGLLKIGMPADVTLEPVAGP